MKRFRILKGKFGKEVVLCSILITYAPRGIGLEVGRLLVGQNWRVIAAAERQKRSPNQDFKWALFFLHILFFVEILYLPFEYF